jgi:hypothetical protein
VTTGFTSLTGRWLGRYEYPYGAPPVTFEAELTDLAGELSGEIYEPNTFRPDAGPELSADILGQRDGGQVTFLKRYRGLPSERWPHYDGTVNARLTRIEGRWLFAQVNFSGRFVMMRKPLAGAAVEKVAEAVI